MKDTRKLGAQARLFSNALKSTFGSASLPRKDHVASKENLTIAKVKTASAADWSNMPKSKSTKVMAPCLENPNQMKISGNEYSFPANDVFESNPPLLTSPSDLHSLVENSCLASFQETLCMVTNNENDSWLKNKRLMALQQLGYNSQEHSNSDVNNIQITNNLQMALQQLGYNSQEYSSSDMNDIWITNNRQMALQQLGYDSPDQYSSSTSLAPSYNSDSSGKMSPDTVYDPSDFSPKSSVNSLSFDDNSLRDAPVKYEKSIFEEHERTLERQEEIKSEWSQEQNISKSQKYFQEKSVFSSEEKFEGISNERTEFICKNTNQSGFEKSQLKNSKSESTSLNCCEIFHDKSSFKNKNNVAKLPSYDVTSLMTLESTTGFFDSHCHIDRLFNRQKFRGTYTDYMARNKKSYPKSYKGCIAVFCDPHTFAKEYLWRKHLEQNNVWGAFGCHPKSAKFYDGKVEKCLEAALNHPKVKALGEIGLDYSNGNKSSKLEQHNVFRRQLRIAQKRNLRVVIHCRDADDDAIKIMHEILPKDAIFHLHCFTGTWERAQIWIKEFPNVFIGITNRVTFPSAWETHEVARELPLERLLLETDAPYFVPTMAPRGTSFSHPGMAIHVAAQIAAFKNIPVETVLNWTSANTKIVYDIP